MFEKRNNSTTLSVYVLDVTAKCYDEKTETIETRTFQLFAEKAPSESVLKKELEDAGFTVLGRVLVTENKVLSGLYSMSHEEFMKHAVRVGDTRPKKEKQDK
ncbi:MAG: hypothetical protein IIZ78_00870 [Clostridiales bacterium]|nr:hypothetical protein [Clostridiales bacterium]